MNKEKQDNNNEKTSDNVGEKIVHSTDKTNYHGLNTETLETIKQLIMQKGYGFLVIIFIGSHTHEILDTIFKWVTHWVSAWLSAK